MKKPLLLLSLIASISLCYAQSAKFGITGGLNESSQYFSGSGYSQSSSLLTGFRLGVFTEYTIGNSYTLQPGLLYTTKGGHNATVTQNVTATTITQYQQNGNLTLNYLELPVNLIHHFRSNFFIGAGPYLAAGLSGSFKSSGTQSTTTVTPGGIITSAGAYSQNSSIVYGSEPGDEQRLDFGFNALAGFRLKNDITLSANYSQGLTNTIHDNAVKNNVMSIGLGYYIR